MWNKLHYTKDTVSDYTTTGCFTPTNLKLNVCKIWVCTSVSTASSVYISHSFPVVSTSVCTVNCLHDDPVCPFSLSIKGRWMYGAQSRAQSPSTVSSTCRGSTPWRCVRTTPARPPPAGRTCVWTAQTRRATGRPSASPSCPSLWVVSSEQCCPRFISCFLSCEEHPATTTNQKSTMFFCSL